MIPKCRAMIGNNERVRDHRIKQRFAEHGELGDVSCSASPLICNSNLPTQCACLPTMQDNAYNVDDDNNNKSCVQAASVSPFSPPSQYLLDFSLSSTVHSQRPSQIRRHSIDEGQAYMALARENKLL